MNNIERTVAVQKAIGATHALVSIANGAPWSAYQQLKTDTRGIVTERMAQTILDGLQPSPAAPPPADSEDRQLATIARGIAEHIEVYELPLSNEVHFSFSSGDKTYAGDLYPHPTPLMEALRQLALWKAGQQAAEAGEAAPVDALTEAQQRIAELEAQVGKLQQAAEMSNNLWLDEKRRYESLYRTHIKLQHEHEELENLVIHSLGASPADWGRSQADIESLIDQNIELTFSDNRETRNDWSDTELGENTITNGIFRLKERIAELEAERDSAVMDANKRLAALREIVAATSKATKGYLSNLDEERVEAKFETLTMSITDIVRKISPSVPESEVTDGA